MLSLDGAIVHHGGKKMATHTPNLNLGKPDSSDAFSLFIALFNDNMDILDGLSSGVTYTLSISDHTITLNGSDGSSSSVTVPDTIYSGGDGIDITSNVISLDYLKVVNGAVNLVFDDGN